MFKNGSGRDQYYILKSIFIEFIVETCWVVDKSWFLIRK